MELKQTTERSMGFKTLGPFFALAFGLTWGIVALYIVFEDPIEAAFGDMAYTHPLFGLAVYSPGLAGVSLVWWERFGSDHVGVADLFQIALSTDLYRCER